VFEAARTGREKLQKNHPIVLDIRTETSETNPQVEFHTAV
jgi:hypothetical protein